MVRHQSVIRPEILFLGLTAWLGAVPPLEAQQPEPPRQARAGRVFAASKFSVDEILARPFDRDVPMGCTGDRVWASSPQDWAFRDDVHWLLLTNLKAFALELRDEHGLRGPGNPPSFPSHIHSEGSVRGDMKATAPFPFALDRVENPFTTPFFPEKR